MTNRIAAWRLNPGGTFIPETIQTPGEPGSLDEITRMLPGGAYTTFRTFGRYRVLRLADHFERLEETARLAGHPLALDRAAILQALHAVLGDYPAEDIRVRVILDLEREPGALYALIEPLHMPTPADYEQGVRVVTRHLQRQNPKAKLTGFIQTANAVRQDLPAGINEALMIGEDGRALEGLSSNFFAVKDGIVWTAEQGVLSGITRSLALEVIRAQGIPLRLEGIPAADLPSLDEAFITSASRAVLPVTEIDGRRVGDGRPGAVTQQLVEGYRARVEQELELV